MYAVFINPFRLVAHMIIFFKKIDFYKIFCMTSLCTVLLIVALAKLPNYYQIPTVTVSLKGCEEYSMEFVSSTIRECSFVDETGYNHIVTGYPRDKFNKMSSEPVNKMFVINDSRYEDAIKYIIFFAAVIFYLSIIPCLIMTAIAITNKIDKEIEKKGIIKNNSVTHIDA